MGVDCLGLLVGVATELQLCDKVGRPLNEFDELNYGHLPDEKRLYNQLQQLLQRVERPKAGAIGLFKVDGSARHLGIIGENRGYLTLIHAYAPARKVIEHRLDDEWEKKLYKVFTVG